MSNKLTPITREEYFLAKAGGQEVPTLEPITREEYFLEDIIEAIDANLAGKIITVPDTDKYKAYATFEPASYKACFITGWTFTDRLRVGAYYYAGKNGKNQILISSAADYDPAEDGELTVENAGAKSTPSDIPDGTMKFYGMNKSGATAGTSWYARPVLYVDNEVYCYGDMYKFEIDNSNNITATHYVGNTKKDVVTSAFYLKRTVWKWHIDDSSADTTETVTYSPIMTGVPDVTSAYGSLRYAEIDPADFTDQCLTLCYQTGDGVRHYVDTIIVPALG